MGINCIKIRRNAIKTEYTLFKNVETSWEEMRVSADICENLILYRKITIELVVTLIV